MKLFDLHCDTANELYKTNSSMLSNELAVSLETYQNYDKKAQVFAIWSDKDKTDDECYLAFQRIAANLSEQIDKNDGLVIKCNDFQTLEDADNKLCAILGVEDARLLAADISRLERLYYIGVRVLTLCWSGKTCIGGAFDTEQGLTDFGFEVLSECEKMGITVDVSHMSQKSFWDVASKATKPFIASHSNSFSICPHPRNLTDTQYRTIVSAGGIVGISLAGAHLSATLADTRGPGIITPEHVVDCVCEHIMHFLEIDSKHLCFGFDFDGTTPLPGLENVSKVQNIRLALEQRKVPAQIIDDVFYNNACEFFSQALKNSENK